MSKKKTRYRTKFNLNSAVYIEEAAAAIGISTITIRSYIPHLKNVRTEGRAYILDLREVVAYHKEHIERVRETRSDPLIRERIKKEIRDTRKTVKIELKRLFHILDWEYDKDLVNKIMKRDKDTLMFMEHQCAYENQGSFELWLLWDKCHFLLLLAKRRSDTIEDSIVRRRNQPVD